MDKILTKKEVAQWLKVSEPTIDRWRKQGLPSIKTNRLVRFNLEEVSKWLMEKNQK